MVQRAASPSNFFKGVMWKLQPPLLHIVFLKRWLTPSLFVLQKKGVGIYDIQKVHTLWEKVRGREEV